MPKSCIPGYDEALAKEALLRRSVFIGVPYGICGIPIHNITPFLLARLRVFHSAFIEGGTYDLGEVLKFLWAMSPKFSENQDEMDAFFEESAKSLAELESLSLAFDEIDQFIEETFMDGPQGGAESVPYVIGEAWMVYTFMKDPFRWTEEQALHTPYRKLFQYLRCVKLDNDQVVYNESDKVKDAWMLKVREEWAKNQAQPGGNN